MDVLLFVYNKFMISMKNFTVRIVIPTNVGELLKLATLVYKKHQADGANSYLHSLEDYKWDEVGPNLELAAAKHDEAEKLPSAPSLPQETRILK
jgi:hypothetical protein